MKHCNALLALLAVTASSSEATRDRTIRTANKKETRNIPNKQPTTTPSYNPTEWPTWFPTVPQPPTTKKPSKRADATPRPTPTSPLTPPPPTPPTPPLVSNALVMAEDDIINLPTGTEEAYIGVLENDTGSNLVVRSITSQGAFGQCVISINLAEVVYTPSSPTFIGSDECRYEACDGEEDCSEATVRITIKKNTTSDPTLFPGPRPEPTPNPPPTKNPSIFLGTIATQAPTLNRNRPTNKPTNQPVTPFPTEEEVIGTGEPTFSPTKKAEDSYKTTDSYDGYYVERYPAASSESSESKSADEYKPKNSHDSEKSYDSGWKDGVTSHDSHHSASKSSKSSSTKSSKASGPSWSSGSGDSWTGSSGRIPYSSSSGSSWIGSGSGSGNGKSRKLRKNLRH